MTTYKAGYVPDKADQLIPFLRDELAKLERALNAPNQILHVQPERRYDGLEVEADGTDWDPGSGAGKYAYRSGVWVFIG